MDTDKTNRIESETNEERETSLVPAETLENFLEKTEKKKGLKERMKKIRLPHFEDRNQQKAFGNILRFFALILILTLVARGTAGATLAVVKTAASKASEVVEKIDAQGTVSAGGSHIVKTPEGLVVEEMLVTAGQKVEVGDKIAQFDPREVMDLLAEAKATLAQMETDLKILQSGEAHDSTPLAGAQNTLTWAEQDVNTVQAAGTAAIAEAQAKLDAAKANLTAAQAAVDALTEETAEPERTAAEQALAAAQAAVPEAQIGLDNAVATAASQNQEAQRKVEAAKQGLTSAQIADQNARKTAGENQAKNVSLAELKRLEIVAQEEKISLLELIDGDGILKSDGAGTVLEVGKEGMKTAEGSPLVRISDAKNGFEAVATLDKKVAETLTAGGTAEVTTGGGSYYYKPTATATITAIGEPDEADKVKVTLGLPDGEWKQGQSVDISVIKSQKKYDTCIPIGALHQNSSGYFVLVVDTTSGVLGEENVIRLVPVSLIAKDTTTAAIESGALSPADKIVTESSKPIEAGDKVRDKT